MISLPALERLQSVLPLIALVPFARVAFGHSFVANTFLGGQGMMLASPGLSALLQCTGKGKHGQDAS